MDPTETGIVCHNVTCGVRVCNDECRAFHQVSSMFSRWFWGPILSCTFHEAVISIQIMRKPPLAHKSLLRLLYLVLNLNHSISYPSKHINTYINTRKPSSSVVKWRCANNMRVFGNLRPQTWLRPWRWQTQGPDGGCPGLSLVWEGNTL